MIVRGEEMSDKGDATKKRRSDAKETGATAKKVEKKIKMQLKPLPDGRKGPLKADERDAGRKQLPPKPSVFEEDSDSGPEEMPPECRMRMRNLGRDTPTSSGPNSFSKGKHGFIDARKLAERKLLMMTQETED